MRIGTLEIRKTGGYSVLDLSKKTEVKNKETGEIKVIYPILASNSYLTWTLKDIMRLGNEEERNDATVILEVLENELGKDKDKGVCGEMESYLGIETKFFENYGKSFEVVNGEVQIKLF